ncbi:MAG TPA: DNA repair protein RadA, partial [Cellvibrionales bacterium]|nr:DNA repair protein RadA [Cellvibrionales bacterium]
MAKAKSAFVCTDCGSEYTKWQGQCTDCGVWNTLSEIRLSTATQRGERLVGYSGTASEVQTLSSIDLSSLP